MRYILDKVFGGYPQAAIAKYTLQVGRGEVGKQGGQAREGGHLPCDISTPAPCFPPIPPLIAGPCVDVAVVSALAAQPVFTLNPHCPSRPPDRRPPSGCSRGVSAGSPARVHS